jgi:hypothetical protein
MLIGRKILKIRVLIMSAMNLDELNDYIANLMKDYKGDIVDLSHAIGAARIGHHYGWRVLRLVISQVSYRKYQKILGLDFKESLPELTIYTEKSAGYQLVTKLNNFWDVVKGIATIDRKEKTSIV